MDRAVNIAGFRSRYRHTRRRSYPGATAGRTLDADLTDLGYSASK
jgi:hypothetical protein